MGSEKHGSGDGRGILSGGYLNEDRPMNRETWLSEVFPEWGNFLNREIEDETVKPGTVTLWWLSGPSWCLKTSAGGVFLIDCYSGPSMYTDYSYCGVCRIGGGIERNSQPRQSVSYAPAHQRRILTNSGGEHECVQTAQCRREHSRMKYCPVNKVVDSEDGTRLPALLKFPHVIANA